MASPLAVSLRHAVVVGEDVAQGYSRPAVHDDGSIEYTPVEGVKQPRDLEGFERDASNPYLFRPLWPLCDKRLYGSQRNRKTGEINLKMICGHSESTHHRRMVGVQACLTCPLAEVITKDGIRRGRTIMEDGSILFAESPTVPPDVDGYTRDPDYPWLFHPSR